MWPMQPRDHLVVFAKRMIPANTFQSPDKMFAELSGAQREAFVFFLWNEAGKQVEKPLPHVDQMKGPDGIPRLAKLEVVGAVKPVGHEIVVISMPPAINANEVLFLALVRRATGVSVFFYERCMGNDHATVSPNEAVLAEVRADGSRLNHGFKEGIDLEAFKQHLGGVLGVSLAGLETSLPPVTMAAFVAAGGGKGGGTGGGGSKGKGVALGNFVAMLALISLAVPLALKIPGVGGLLWPIWRPVDMVLGAVLGISLLIWIYQVHDARRGQTSMSPAMSIVWWFIPVLNFFMIPATLASAWRGATGTGGLGLAWLWWIFYIGVMFIRNIPTIMQSAPGALPIDVVNMMWQFGWVITLVAYGILFYIVKTATSKL